MRLDAVKMLRLGWGVASDTYHHGDLPNALRGAAADVLAERGLAGFSLREVARRAGVSHAAPAHHYGDARGLLTSVAVEAFEHLRAATQAAADSSDDPVESLVRLGQAYVRVAVEHPGHCAVIFRQDAVDERCPEYAAAGAGAYEVLVGALERLATARNPDLDIATAARLCWSAMQGLVALHPVMDAQAGRHGGELPGIEDVAGDVTRLLVAGLAPG